MTGLLVVPAAPAFLPGASARLAPGLAPVADATTAMLTRALRGVGHVSVVAVDDQLRDRDETWAPARTGWAVGDQWLARCGYAGSRRLLAATAWDRLDDVTIVVADGSAAAGAKAPRPEADGEEFDELVHAALRDGRPDLLTAVSDQQAAAVGCTTAAAWRAVAARAGGRSWHCRSLTSFAPYGVTYLAAWLTC